MPSLVLLRTLQEENKFLIQKVQTLESELKWYRKVVFVVDVILAGPTLTIIVSATTNHKQYVINYCNSNPNRSRFCSLGQGKRNV